MNYGFIGCGNMAGAILQGCLKANIITPQDVRVCDNSEARLDYVTKTYGVGACASIADIVDFAQVILIGVKPKDVKDVCAAIQQAARVDKGKGEHVVVSMAADVPIDRLEEYLDANTPIMRVMSNLNAAIGRAVTAYAINAALAKLYPAGELLRRFDFLEAIGQAHELDESEFNIFTALAGCAPAYTYMYIDALARAAVLHGMKKETALKIAAASVEGSAEQLLATSQGDAPAHPWEMIDRVCSPGGMTIKGVQSLQKNRFEYAVAEAVNACLK
ncbi:MAG: pyrroline-5-carboxylate reductase [Clostridiales bacterium]|jgi:pyrroline-5-carboxylate reductase|nr:pyrroline-5-carboxylate reductase [Clostridiales bacterium]